MAIQGVGASVTSAQLLSQDPQAQGATKAQRAEAERAAREAERLAKAEQQAKADQTRQKSVVNAQGQVTGSLINITA